MTLDELLLVLDRIRGENSEIDGSTEIWIAHETVTDAKGVYVGTILDETPKLFIEGD